MNELFQWVLRNSLQGTVLIALILLLQFVLRDLLKPRWRHALWLVLVVRLLLPAAPQSALSIYSLLPDINQSTVSSTASVIVEKIQESQTQSMTPSDVTIQTKTPAGGPEDVASSINQRSDNQSHSPTTTPTLLPNPTIQKQHYLGLWLSVLLPCLWLTGTITILLITLLQGLRLSRYISLARTVTDIETLALLKECKQRLSIRSNLELVETAQVHSPALFGFLSPRLLLPIGSIEKLGPQRLRHVFLHELAHLKRYDIALNWILAATQALHWFNPLVWYAFYRMRTDREMACDALALEHMNPDTARDYGQTILDMLENNTVSKRGVSLAGIVEDASQMKKRITSIARYRKETRRWTALAITVLLILAFFTLSDPVTLSANDTQPNKTTYLTSTKIPPTIQGNDWKVTLPKYDLTVELVAISQHPSSENSWHGPDGNNLTGSFGPSSGGKIYTNKKKSGYEIVASVSAPKDIDFTATLYTKPAGSMASTSSKSLNKKSQQNIQSTKIAISLPENINNCSVYAKVAVGDWYIHTNYKPWRIDPETNQKIILDSSSTSSGAGSAVFSKAIEIEDRTQITFTHNMGNSYQIRLVAIDQSGKSHEETNMSAGGSISGSNSGDLYLSTFDIDLPLEQIDSILLKIRPYQIIEFENVELHPITDKNTANIVVQPNEAQTVSNKITALNIPPFPLEEFRPLLKLFGPNSQIHTNPDTGTMSSKSNPKGELSEIVFRNEVVVRSERLNLDCDTFTFTADDNTIVATGNPLTMHVRDGQEITAERLVYDLDADKIELTGRPVIKNKDGSIVTGYKIILSKLNNGSSTIIIEGGPKKNSTENNGKPIRKKAVAQREKQTIKKISPAKELPNKKSKPLSDIDLEIETHYNLAHPEVQEFLRHTMASFGRSKLWLPENTFDELSAEDHEKKVLYFAKALEEGQYGRHLCRALAEAGPLKDKRLLPGLLKVANYHRDDRDYDCRPKWMAVAALGRLGDTSVVPDLIALIDHGNLNTRMWARASLVRITGRSFGENKQDWTTWWGKTVD